MKNKKIKIALLFGGRSAEHEVSLTSAKSIYSNLDRERYEIVSIYINKEGNWRVVNSPLHDFSELSKGHFEDFLPWRKSHIEATLEADIYFPVLHGPYGEDGTLQGLFELCDVPYVGAMVMASAIGMDKAMSKTIFQAENLPVVNHIALLDTEWKKHKDDALRKITSGFDLPFFVKPANLGSSVGISKINDYEQCGQAIHRAFLYDRKILIEEGIRGQEFECSVLGNEAPRASLPGEVIPYREFYDYEDKYLEGKTSFVIPAEIPSSLVKEIQEISIKAYRSIDCSGMARIDFFLQEQTEKLFLNEINTIPGFTEISMYPKLWEASGLSFSRLLDELIALGFESHKKKINKERKKWDR
jgi:D-alanine-D-alanine ligase